MEATQQSAESLLTLINDILDFSKMEAGKLAIDRVAFDLAKLIDSLIDVFAPRAMEKNLDLLSLIEPDVPTFLLGDSGRIRQILVNLLGNAVKFTETGHIFIRVSCEANHADHCRLLFEVTDTGIGIPADKMDQLFTLFSQVDGTTTRKFGGTGLGLAISRQLSRLMGGDIGVVSTPGAGSKFWFTLSIDKAGRDTAAGDDHHLSGLNILVADPSEIHQQVYQSYLKGFGCAHTLVTTAEEVRSAIKAAEDKHQPYDLVLVNLELPDMPGSHVCRYLTGKRTTAVPILMVPGQRPGAFETNKKYAPYFLFKPIKKRDLLLTLQAAAGPDRQQGQPDTMPADLPSPPVRPVHPTGKSLRILLAEDKPVNQRVVTLMLEGAGHQVGLAGNGEEALEMMASRSFDMILMDIQMPVMGGEEACRKIREQEKGTGLHVPIVALTANAMKGDRERYLALGMDAYVSKPVKKQGLLQTIHSLSS